MEQATRKPFERHNGSGADSLLLRAFRILESFDTEHSELRLSDIARRAHLPLSTAHRILGDLVAWGALERESDRYRIGLRLFELGTIAPSWQQHRTAALPYMEDLYEATHESVHLAVLDGCDIVYLLKIHGHEPTPLTRTGGRRAAHCTGLGKALLAFSPRSTQESVVAAGLARNTPFTIVAPDAFYKELDEIRSRGIAFDRQESVPGLGCVAAPIFSRDQQAVAAISVSGPLLRLDITGLGPAIRAAALGVTRQLL